MKHTIFHILEKSDWHKGYTGKNGKRILRREHNHTEGIQPLPLFPEKEDHTTGKTERHPFGEKQAIEADCRF